MRPCGILACMPWKPKTNRRPAPISRPSAHARGYDRYHRKLRTIVLQRDPLCKLCPIYRAGQLVNPATQADHITPLSKGGESSLDNLQGACSFCNNRKNGRLLP